MCLSGLRGGRCQAFVRPGLLVPTLVTLVFAVKRAALVARPTAFPAEIVPKKNVGVS